MGAHCQTAPGPWGALGRQSIQRPPIDALALLDDSRQSISIFYFYAAKDALQAAMLQRVPIMGRALLVGLAHLSGTSRACSPGIAVTRISRSELRHPQFANGRPAPFGRLGPQAPPTYPTAWT